MRLKRFFFLSALLAAFLMTPLFHAAAASQSDFHELLQRSMSSGAAPSEVLTGQAVSGLLSYPLSDSTSALTLCELCSLMRTYLHENTLILPRLSDETLSLPWDTPHRAELEYCYQGGILGELPTQQSAYSTLSLGQGCLILTNLLSHAQAPDHQMPTSSLRSNASASIDTLDQALMMGHSNVVGFYLTVQSPLSYAARDGLSTYDYLLCSDLIIPGGRYGSALDALKFSQYKTVYIMLGTNDCTWSYAGLEDYRQQLSEIIELVQAYQKNAKLCIIGISPIGFDELNVKEMFRQDVIRAYNQTQKSLSRKYGFAYLDIFNFLANEDGYNRPEITRDDALHYTAEGYELLLKEIYTHPVV